MQYFQKLIQKDHGFTHTVGDPVPSHDRAGVWALHRGNSKDTGDSSLVFHYDPSRGGGASATYNADRNLALAKTGHMRLKTLRHPDVLKFLTSVEGSDGTIYIATEPATPLATLLANSPSSFDPESVQWGLFTVSRALGFMHSSGLIHGRINPSTVFVTPSGDWKLGGLECVTMHSAAASLAQHATSLQLAPYQSPEFANANWSAVAGAPASAVDSWALGCLMYEVHAGSLTSADQLQNMSVFPKALLSAYQKLLASTPQMRAPAGQVENHPYFKNSKFIELNLFVDNLALKGQLEREAFLNKLANIMDRLPDSFCTNKVLPMLSQSVTSGIGGNAAFSCVIKMKDRLSEHAFTSTIVEKYALSWFGNNSLDRNIRVELYTHLNLFTSGLDDSAINNTVFPSLCSAFQDMNAPALRDAAVKSILSIVDRLTDKNLNSVLMSHFARLQVDPEPAIRTNTTVCLGKIAPKLSQTAKSKVLAPAFIRSLKDPFPPARSAGTSAILATTDMYPTKDIAVRILPALVPLLVDPSGDVRSLAFKVLNNAHGKLTRNHENMLRSESAAAASAAATAQQNGGDHNSASANASSAASSGSGWGLSSFSSMTAALLSKSDSSSSVGAAAPTGSSTGISSDSFRVQPNNSNSGTTSVAVSASSSISRAGASRPPAGRPPAHVSSTGLGVGGSAWGDANGTGGAQSAGGDSFASFAADDIGSNGANNNGFNDLALDADDDDDDGWGDMDVKTDSNNASAVDEDDLLASMLGQPATKTQSLPAGLKKAGASQQNDADDLWNLAPPMVSKPKPKPVQRTGAGLSGANRAARGTTTRRSGSAATGDDWSTLLGGSGTSTRRKPGLR